MARPKGSHDIAPMIRGAFIRAAKQLEAKGKPLSKLIYDHLEDDFLNTLKVIASFCPKEMIADITTRKVNNIAELTDDELEQLAMVASSVIGEDGAGEAGERSEEPNSVH